MSNQPFLVISYAIPDRASGTPVVIRKFLENFRSDEVVLIGRPTLKKERIANVNIHYPTMTIPTPPVGFRGEKLWRFLSIFLGSITGLIAIMRYRPKAILAFYRDESSLLTGYWLHKLTGLPLYSYFCDVYLENFPEGLYGKLAAWLQPRVFHESKKVIVLTEAMKDYFEHKYQIDTIVLPHCNNKKVVIFKREITNEDTCRIGYLGSINIDRIQSLQLLCQAINGNQKYQLTYFSATSKEIFQKLGLKIENSSIEFIPDDEQLLKHLSSCDILFLPLAASQERRDREAQVSTGFPTKVIEYLLCQLPILVHSGNNTFGAQFMEDRQCGYNVYGGSEDMLSALNILSSNLELRKQLIINSMSALLYFNGPSIAQKFRELISQKETD